MCQTIKLVFVGDSGVGKSTFVKRHLNGQFERKHEPTMGCEVHPLNFLTTKGLKTINVWDTAGQEELKGLLGGYYLGASAFVVFFDKTNRKSFENVENWVRVIREYSEAPILIVGNKVDVKVEEKEAIKYEELEPYKARYYDISAKSNYNFEKPFLWVLRKVFGQNLNFVEEVQKN